MTRSEPERHSHGEWIRDALARHERPLVAYATRLVGDVDRARDVVQEVFLRLCKSKREDVETRLAEWLYTVTRNLAVDVRRKESRMTSLSDDAVHERDGRAAQPGAAIELGDEAAHVLRRMAELPSKQREALRLKFQHGLSYKEIARVMNESVGNVGWLIHVGIKGLRQRLEGPVPGEGAEA